MSFSELKTLESEVIRLEKAHTKTADSDVRVGIAAKILEHCKRISDLEKRAFISYKVRVEELIPRYQALVGDGVLPAAPATPPRIIPPPTTIPTPTHVTPPPAPEPVVVRLPEPPVSVSAPAAPTPPVVVPPVPTVQVTAVSAPIPVDVSLLAAKVEALGRQAFSPEAYPGRKLQYERLIQEIVTAKDSAGSEAPFLPVLTRLWEFSVREDDAFEDHRKLNR